MTATTIPARNERSLVERAVSGDAEAFAEIVQTHQKRIYSVALAIVRDEMEADAVTQDTFIQAYRHLSRFEGRSELETWLTRIAINRARDSTRRRRRWISWSFGAENDSAGMLDPVDENPDAERLMESRQLRHAIDRSLVKLSERQRIIFQLRHFDGRTLEEIASILGLKAGTVRAHLFRAIRKVREELRPWTTSGTGGAA